jgi:hypothetical protein
MFCPVCGASNEDDSIFCGTCGAEIASGEPVTSSSIGTGMEIAKPDSDEVAAGDLAEAWPESPSPGGPTREPVIPLPPPSGPTPQVRSSGLALLSLLLGIAGLTVLPLLASILAIIFGYMARNDIRQRPDELTGDGLAVAGIVMGWIAVGVTALIALLVALGLGAGICGFGLCGITSTSVGY